MLREAWRQVAPHVSEPGDVVFSGREGIVHAGLAEVADEMRTLLVRKAMIRP
jgi:hypothetical protein